jgi:hypothetical protein
MGEITMASLAAPVCESGGEWIRDQFPYFSWYENMILK